MNGRVFSTCCAGSAALILGTSLLAVGDVGTFTPRWASSPEPQGPTPQARLVSYDLLPEMSGATCESLQSAHGGHAGVGSALQEDLWPNGPGGVSRQAPGATASPLRGPLRVIRDPYPNFSAVAVDMERDEVVAGDENLFQILVFDRMANTLPSVPMTKPRRVFGGDRTKVEFISGLQINQRTGEIFGVNNDTEDTMVIFSREQDGNVRPARELNVPHGTFGLAMDERNEETFLTIQHDSAVVVFRKDAVGDEAPVRVLQGDRTRLADPHGIAVDTKNGVLFVANYGAVANRDPDFLSGQLQAVSKKWPLGRNVAIPGGGRFLPPAITVHARTADGNAPPLRVIEGPKTRLNMPSGLAVSERRGELYVANDMEHSILVFSTTAQGDAAPIRILKGDKTGLKHPTGLFLDTKNNELWVANFGNHTLSVFSPTADGDVPPLRTIRSAPAGSKALMIGNPGALAYDPRREEILVPN